MDKKTIYANELDLKYSTEDGKSSFPISIIARDNDEEIQIFIGKGQAGWLRKGLKCFIEAEKNLRDDW